MNPGGARPRLLAALIAVVALAGASLLRAETEGPEQLRNHSLDLVNEARAAQGLPELTRDPALDRAAQAHAEDMLERDFFAHVSPEGATLLDRYRAAGGDFPGTMAENIGRCDTCRPPPEAAEVERLHEGWMASPQHRANILGAGVDRYGFGVAVSPEGGLFAVQKFAGPGAERGTGGEASALDGLELVAAAVELVNEARRQRGVPALEVDAKLAEAADALLPDADRLEDLALDRLGDARAALPAGLRDAWRRLAVLAGMCTACGDAPTAGDARWFRDRWLERPDQSAQLLNGEFTHLGFALHADGHGRKAALAFLAGG